MAARASGATALPLVPPPPYWPGRYVCGSLNRFTSEKDMLEKFTPTSGPGGLLRTPGGKFCWTINPAVREVNAFWSLLKNAAVPALVMASSTSSGKRAWFVSPRHQTPRTNPSRSTTAMTLFVETCAARVVACAITVATSLEVIWPKLENATEQNTAKAHTKWLRLCPRPSSSSSKSVKVGIEDEDEGRGRARIVSAGR